MLSPELFAAVFFPAAAVVAYFVAGFGAYVLSERLNQIRLWAASWLLLLVGAVIPIEFAFPFWEFVTLGFWSIGLGILIRAILTTRRFCLRYA